MRNFLNNKLAVSNAIFGVTIAFLVIVSAVGFGLYGMSIGSTSKTVTVTNTATTEMMTTEVTTENSINHTSSTEVASISIENAFMLSPKSGAMISNAWLLTVPIGMNEYAISIHAEGLEPDGTYIVEGALSSGSMSIVPVSSQSMTMNITSASEFQADKNGTGLYWIVLDSNPIATFESMQLLYLPGMSMSNATVVATANFTLLMNNTSTMMTGSG